MDNLISSVTELITTIDSYEIATKALKVWLMCNIMLLLACVLEMKENDMKNYVLDFFSQIVAYLYVVSGIVLIFSLIYKLLLLLGNAVVPFLIEFMLVCPLWT